MPKPSRSGKCYRLRSTQTVAFPRCTRFWHMSACFQEPLLAFRPPIALSLAPGDIGMAVRFRTKNAGRVNYKTPFGTGEQWGGMNQTFAARRIVQASSGKILQRSRMVVNKQVYLFIGGSSGVTAEYDGATVYPEYAYSSCPSFIADLANIYRTKLSFRASNPSLLRQDRSLP